MEKKTFKKAFNNSAWMIAAKIINIIIGLTVNVCVTRYLGAEQKGAMADAQAIASFWGFIASFGLLDIMISKFSQDRIHSGITAASGMTIIFCSGVAAFLLALISAMVLGVGRDILIYVVISSLVYIFQCLSVYEYWFYSNSNTKYYAVAQSAVHIIFLAVRFIGVLLKADLIYFIIAISLESICIYLSLLLCYKIAKCSFVGRFAFDKEIAVGLLKLALPMVAMGFATTIYMKVDQIMVGKLMGNTELGLYSVAVTLAEYWYFVPATIYSSFLPVLTENFSDKNMFIQRIQQFADIMSFIGYIAVVGVTVLGHWGVVLLYGTEFEESAYILMIYIWSGLLTCVSYSAQAYYIIHKDTKIVMWTNIIGAVLNLVLNLILISFMGSIGAAFATLIEYTCVIFGPMIILRKKYGELYTVQLKALFPFIRLGSYCFKKIKERL